MRWVVWSLLHSGLALDLSRFLYNGNVPSQSNLQDSDSTLAKQEGFFSSVYRRVRCGLFGEIAVKDGPAYCSAVFGSTANSSVENNNGNTSSAPASDSSASLNVLTPIDDPSMNQNDSIGSDFERGLKMLSDGEPAEKKCNQECRTKKMIKRLREALKKLQRLQSAPVKLLDTVELLLERYEPGVVSALHEEAIALSTGGNGSKGQNGYYYSIANGEEVVADVYKLLKEVPDGEARALVKEHEAASFSLWWMG